MSDPKHREAVARDLGEWLPARSILATVEALRPYECDALTAHRALPLIVVLPDTVEQVQSVLRYCSANRIPVVARGAGTGLSGGAMPHERGVLLSLAKFDQVLEVDPQTATATVQPGVRNLAISEAAAPHGLYYAPDPSSQLACTIGGNVAENSGGVHCLKYGLTVHNLQSMRVLTVDGELLELGGAGLDEPGYDLMAVMTGSEGMLGVVVEVTVKLLPRPAQVEVLLAAFAQTADAGRAVGEVIAAGVVPAGLEMMDRLAIQATEDFAGAGYPRDAAAILLCELDGTAAEVTAQKAVVRKLFERNGAYDIQEAASAEARDRLWRGRKSAFPAMGRIAPDYYCMDGTIPRRHLADVLAEIEQISRRYELPIANVFHAGDGNLHPLIVYDGNEKGALQRAEAAGAEILDLCCRVGGTITGEHGVGVEKIDRMCVQFAPVELAQFHALKAAFDPMGLLNPGKAVPTLNRCAEFGAMHVHRGSERFPHLPRF